MGNVTFEAEAPRERTQRSSRGARVPVAARMLPWRFGATLAGGAALLLAGTVAEAFTPGERGQLRGLVATASEVVGLMLLLAASTRFSPSGAIRSRYVSGLAAGYRRCRHVVLLAAAMLALTTLLAFAAEVNVMLRSGTARTYTTDILALADEDARLVLSGHNPYTSDWAYRVALQRFPHASATPQRGRTFGYGDAEPSAERIYTVQRAYVASSRPLAGAFDPRTLHSYPALSFLLYVPLLWAGIPNIVVLHILVYWALFAWLVWLAPVGWRQWAALGALSATVAMVSSLMTANEVICITLVLAAWHWRDRRWLSTILLGLACAYKQYCWFFVPVMALEIGMAEGWSEVARRAPIGLAAFLAPNLPFILLSPRSWFTSLWLPMTTHAFANGVGVVALSMGGIIPFAPLPVYAALEVAAVCGVLVLYARYRWRLREAALLLALMPLFFAFRSLASYFAFAPWLALYAANRLYIAEGAGRRSSLAARSAGRALNWMGRRSGRQPLTSFTDEVA